MKKGVLLLTGLFLLSSTSVMAHCGTCGIGDEKGSKGSMKADAKDWSQKKTDRLTKKLGLSEAQAAQLKALMEEKKAAMKALHDKYQSGLDAILTPDQKEQYHNMKEKKGSKKGSGKMKGSGHGDHEEHGDHGHDH